MPVLIVQVGTFFESDSGVGWAQVESEDVVFTLETIVEKFGEEMAPFAVGLCEHITQAFWRLQVMCQVLPTRSLPCACVCIPPTASQH